MWSSIFLGLGILLTLPDHSQCCIPGKARKPKTPPRPAPRPINGRISSRCLRCICEVESAGCTENIRCGDGGRSCGPYQIMRGYWSDAGRLGGGYRKCVDKMECAEQTVRGYMNRYARASLLGHTPTCEDFARIHNGGPNGHKKSATDGYWKKIQSKGCTRNS